MLEWLGIRFSGSSAADDFLLLDCSHTYGLVAISYLVACFASFTALDISELIPRAQGSARKLWMTLFAVAMGGGIWSMHFIGMLAFEAPILIRYDPVITGFSFLVATAGCFAAVAINYRSDFNIGRLCAAGIVLGASIVVMHYSGMGAIETEATIRYQPLLFVLSIAIAIGASIVALLVAWYIDERSREYLGMIKLAASLVMGIAICGMHYTGMAASEFYVQGSLADVTPPQTNGGLAVAIGVMTIAIISVALLNSVLGKKLRDQEARFDQAALRYGQVFDMVPDAIITFALNWEIIESNQSARSLFGIKEGAQMILTDLMPDFDDDLMESALGDQGHYCTLTARSATGRSFPAEFSVSPVVEAGARELFLMIGRDISAREELNRMLSERTVELEESNQALARFASVVSHDLRDPLRKIRMFGGKLSASLGDELAEKPALYLSRMIASADRLQAMITGVLSYSRLGTDAEEREWVSLQEMIESVVADLDLSEAETDTAFEFESLPEIYCIPVLFRQVMQNLLANAVKYRKPDVALKIRIKADQVRRPSGEHIEIKVIDNGVGFEPGSSEKIFGIFSRAHGAGEFEGLGIGLATCEKIVRLHGGAIHASSELDRGSVFTVELPLPLG